ncbi:PD-(D/E)XK nuclease family protein [Campylobacter coli]|uniref:PD-(D/E)XK nuclease family protein n=1 Tax=Campylobacter coli TaxID=195 RepID=UPI00296D815D|nr:PD-(D/E)XK nuclease family protein [Campylobacter coli]
MNKNKFDEFVAKNLPQALKKDTEQSLGDRSKYVGSSDIGGCLRKAYLDKTTSYEHDLATLIRFQRGHVAEGIIEKMLDGLNPTLQKEVKLTIEGFDLKAHIDFCLESKNEIVVVEAKSVNTAVDKPYDSWVMQVNFQLALLATQTQKKLRAYVVAINLNTGWFKSFEINHNQTFEKLAIENAQLLANSLLNKEEPAPSEQFYCSTCPHKKTCPLMMKKSEGSELSGDLLEVGKKIIELNARKKELEKELEEKKALIEEYMRTCGAKKIKVDDSFFSLSNDTTSTSFDTKALKDNEPELYESLFEKYQKTSQRKGYLAIK